MLLIMISLLSTRQAGSQTMPSPLAADGGPDCHLYKTDTVILENTILDDGSGIAPANSITTGLNQFHSPNLKFFFIPVSWSITNNLAVDITLPLMHKMLIDNSNDISKLAFGDIKIGLAASFPFAYDTVILSTHLNTTIPTGDSNAAVNSSFLTPLGYGNFTFSLLQSLSVNAPEIHTRFFINAGGILYLPTEYSYSIANIYMVDLSYAVSSMLGFEFTRFKNLSLSLKGNVVYIPERTYKEKNEITGTVSSKNDVNDLLVTSDIIAASTYSFSNNIKGTMMIIFPMWTKQDGDLINTSDRKWKIYLAINKVFSLSDSGNDSVPIPKARPSKTKKKKKKKKTY